MLKVASCTVGRTVVRSYGHKSKFFRLGRLLLPFCIIMALRSASSALIIMRIVIMIVIMIVIIIITLYLKKLRASDWLKTSTFSCNTSGSRNTSANYQLTRARCQNLYLSRLSVMFFHVHYQQVTT